LRCWHGYVILHYLGGGYARLMASAFARNSSSPSNEATRTSVANTQYHAPSPRRYFQANRPCWYVVLAGGPSTARTCSFGIPGRRLRVSGREAQPPLPTRSSPTSAPPRKVAVFQRQSFRFIVIIPLLPACVRDMP